MPPLHLRFRTCDHCWKRRVTRKVLRDDWPDFFLCEECSELPPSEAMDDRIKDRLWADSRWD